MFQGKNGALRWQNGKIDMWSEQKRRHENPASHAGQLTKYYKAREEPRLTIGKIGRRLAHGNREHWTLIVQTRFGRNGQSEAGLNPGERKKKKRKPDDSRT